MTWKNARLIFVLLVAAALPWFPRVSSAVPLTQAGPKLSLNGAWMLAVAKTPGAASAYQNFYNPGFDENGMREIDVPSHWELRGFEPARYADPNRSVGFYRKSFTAPEHAPGERVLLHFEGVLYGAEVWINGTRLGRHLGGFTGFEFDATDAIRPGRQNLLAVKVEKATTPAYGYDCSDAWALSGIYRDVYLYQVPAVHLAAIKIETDLDDHYRDAVLTAYATVRNTQASPAAVALSITLQNDAGEEMASQSAGLEVGPSETKTFKFSLPVSDPAKWSAEDPKLYRLAVTVKSGASASTTIHSVGFREVEIKNGLLLINGVPVKLRGVNRHETSIVNGRALTSEQMAQDLDLMRAANINTVRTSHYPPDPEFLDLCDRRGFYVIDEAPFNFHEELLYMPWVVPLLLDRVSETIARDQNHPSVIIWSLGNENPWSPSHPPAVKLARSLDPTRPVTIPQTGYRNGDIRGNLPPEVQVLAPHYPTPELLRRIIAHQKQLANPRPIVMTEFLHSLGRHYWTREIWDVVWSDPLAAGGCVWDWADQGIRRPIDGGRVYEMGENIPYRPGDLIRYANFDANHIVDSHGIFGTDGLVYADRTPQPDYYEIRKIYTPISVKSDSIEVEPGQIDISFAVQNRFDFTLLDSARLSWRLLADTAGLDSGSMSYPPLAPRETGTVTIPATLPDRLIASAAYQLAVDSFDAGGTMVDTHIIELVPKADSASNCLDDPAVGGPLEVSNQGQELTVGNGALRVVFDRATGNIIRVSAQGKTTEMVGPTLNTWRPLDPVETAQPSYAFYAVEKEPSALERLRVRLGIIKNQAYNTYGLLTDLKAMSQSRATVEVESQSGGTVVVVSEAEYAAPHRGRFEFRRKYIVSNKGRIEVKYEIRPLIGSTRLLELGVGFDLPAAYDELEWFGVGPDAYPATIRNSQVSRNAVGSSAATGHDFFTNKTDVRWAIIKGGNLPIGFERRGELIGNVRATRDQASTRVLINPWVKQPGKKHRDPGKDLEVMVDDGKAFSGRLTIRPALTRDEIQHRRDCITR